MLKHSVMLRGAAELWLFQGVWSCVCVHLMNVKSNIHSSVSSDLVSTYSLYLISSFMFDFLHQLVDNLICLPFGAG